MPVVIVFSAAAYTSLFKEIDLINLTIETTVW